MAGVSQVTNSQPVKELGSNGTSTAVTAASPFVGEWARIPVGSMLYVAVYSDADLDVVIEYSVDGSTADSTLTRYYRTGFINPPYDFKNARPFVRVSASVSGAADATATRINTFVSSGEPLLNIPVDATMAQNYGAISVRPTNFISEVALGRRQGWSTWNKFGFNLDVDTGGAEVIASFGGTFQYLTSGETINIVSTDTADDLVGTGVQRIVVYGIDGNWDEQIEVFEMDGTTTVTSTSTWIGINRVAIFKAGSGGTNAGTITITASSSGYSMAQMPAGGGVTQQAIFYVPRNHQFLASWLRANVNKISGGGSPRVTIKGIVYSDVNTAEQEVYRDTIDTNVDEFVTVRPPEPFVIGEKSILYFTAETDVLNTVVSCRFSGELVRDVDA